MRLSRALCRSSLYSSCSHLSWLIYLPRPRQHPESKAKPSSAVCGPTQDSPNEDKPKQLATHEQNAPSTARATILRPSSRADFTLSMLHSIHALRGSVSCELLSLRISIPRGFEPKKLPLTPMVAVLSLVCSASTRKKRKQETTQSE